MRRYIHELRKKSPAHRSRFALLASGGFTLAIFVVWFVVTFGPEAPVAKDTTGPVNLAAVEEAAAPFENILEGIRDAWGSLTGFINGK